MAYAENPTTPSWASRLGIFYTLAVFIALLCCSLVYSQIAKTTPNDPNALEVTQARFTAHAGYQTNPPQQLQTAATVELPHRIDDRLRGPGGFYWYQFDFTAQPGTGVEALYIPRFAMNAEVYLNGERLAYFGPMTGQFAERNWNRPQMVQLGPTQLQPGSNTISMQVRAFPDYLAGLSTVWLGSNENLREAYRARYEVQVTTVYLSTAFVLGAGIVLAILIVLGKSRNSMLVLLGVTCVLWGVRNLAFLTTTPPVEHGAWIQITQGGLLVFASLIALLGLLYCKVPKRRLEWKIWLAYTLSFPVFILINENWALRLVGYYGIVGLTMYSWLVILMIRMGNATQSLSPHAFGFGLLCYTLLSVSDLLYLAGILPFDGYFLNQYMGIVMFLAMSYFLIERYSTMLSDSDRFNETLQASLAAREAELADQYKKLQKIDEEKVKMTERQRLMADMHDGIGAHLVAAIHHLQSSNFNRKNTLNLLESGLRDLQLTIDSLEPIEQDLTTLLGAFRYRIADTMRSAGIRLHWVIDDNIPAIPYLDARNCLHVLRIVQEVFTNVLKHANATEISLQVTRGPKYVGVQINDNGVGFVLERCQHGRGLKNLAQRAEALGGSIDMSTEVGHGTRFLLKLPLDE
ncbi:sensor histidine kinase [Limnobacter parvus]|uniref:histidine kinase n=1 Tax=Limnobacter parvus TaxID=2939690 RepID=A0ABT1XGA7_9BURK|nr:ATP-binding protein [Limnobacter parvus]MCR2745337.1 ATP-binding protein [Limnobacter parvus]